MLAIVRAIVRCNLGVGVIRVCSKSGIIVGRRGRVVLMLWGAGEDDLVLLCGFFVPSPPRLGRRVAMYWNCGGIFSLGVEKMEKAPGVLQK